MKEKIALLFLLVLPIFGHLKVFHLFSDVLIHPVNMKFTQVGGTEVRFRTTCQ
ncbi:MAG: hypothetical protein FWF53_11525 [Candidatus Azobacteroides sp.]|nr:hypothetical protein [Candidatus Azobacteroides sp.]